MPTLRTSLLLAAALSLAACTGRRAAPEDSDRAVAAVEPPRMTTQPDSGDSASVAGDSPEQWTVGAHGFSALPVGTPIVGPDAARRGLSLPPGSDPNGCAYVAWPAAPAGSRLMAEGGRIVRVDVSGETVATEEGARVGDSEARIDSLYRGRVTVTPAKYDTGGHYLTVTPAAPADSAYRLIFETDGRGVTRYRAGIRPAVGYVEACG